MRAPSAKIDEMEFLRLVASLESASEHPLAEAIVRTRTSSAQDGAAQMYDELVDMMYNHIR